LAAGRPGCDDDETCGEDAVEDHHDREGRLDDHRGRLRRLDGQQSRHRGRLRRLDEEHRHHRHLGEGRHLRRGSRHRQNVKEGHRDDHRREAAGWAYPWMYEEDRGAAGWACRPWCGEESAVLQDRPWPLEQRAWELRRQQARDLLEPVLALGRASAQAWVPGARERPAA